MITAAELLAEIGDCRARYPTRDALAADAWPSRGRVQSGKHKAVSFRWGCNKRLRAAFATLADSTRHWHPWAQDLYATAQARGHDHPRALRTIGRAWSRIVWRCWQDGVPYELARHRAAQQHITVTIPNPPGDRVDVPAAQRMGRRRPGPQPGCWLRSGQPPRSATFTAKTAERGRAFKGGPSGPSEASRVAAALDGSNALR